VQQPEAAAVPAWAAGVRQQERRWCGLGGELLPVEAAVRPSEAPDAREAALPSAALWVFRRDRLRRPARPARPPAAVRLALAMGRLPIASP